MKFRRFFSGLIFAVGCVLLFISLLSYALNYMTLPQLTLLRESFYTQSNHTVIQIINHFMLLVMNQHRETAAAGILITSAGILLMNHFSSTPKKAKPPKLEEEYILPFISEPEETISVQSPNPFAVDTYNQRIQTQKDEAKPAFHLPSEPLLERNAIETISVENANIRPEDHTPYIPPRFSVESHAVEAEAGMPSQSGSWILTRNCEFPDIPPVEEVAAPVSESEFALPEKSVSDPIPCISEADFEITLPEVASAPEDTTQKPVRQSSPRIRSTIGRHMNRKTNFSSSDS